MNPDSDPKNTADPQRRRDSDPMWKALSDFEDLLKNVIRLQRVQGLVEDALSSSSSPAQAVNLRVRTSDEVPHHGYLAQQLAACRPAKNEPEFLVTFKRWVELTKGLERMDIKLSPKAKRALFPALHFLRSAGEAGPPEMKRVSRIAGVLTAPDPQPWMRRR